MIEPEHYHCLHNALRDTSNYYYIHDDQLRFFGVSFFISYILDVTLSCKKKGSKNQCSLSSFSIQKVNRVMLFATHTTFHFLVVIQKTAHQKTEAY